MSESPICQIRASVMMYDSGLKRWFPCAGNGLSRIHIYFVSNMMSNQFRIVGRKNDTNDLSLNCMIKKNLIYNEATPTFHQWRYEGNVYGYLYTGIFKGLYYIFRLNFPNQDEAINFSRHMKKCLDDVTGRVPFTMETSETTSSNSEPSSQFSQHSSTNVYHQGQQSHQNKASFTHRQPSYSSQVPSQSNTSSRQMSLNSLNSNMDRIQITDRNYARTRVIHQIHKIWNYFILELYKHNTTHTSPVYTSHIQCL